MLRRSSFAILLLSVAVSGNSVRASCTASRPITSTSFTGISYVYSPGMCDGGYPCGPTSSVSADLEGFFWALGFGNPAPGLGHDNGSRPAQQFYNQGWVRFYGDAQFPSFIDGNWNMSGVDGCIDAVAEPGEGCTALLLADRKPACSVGPRSCVSMTLMTKHASGIGHGYSFAQPGDAPIHLVELPQGVHFWDQEHWAGICVGIPSVPPPALHLDPSCPPPAIVGYKAYVRVAPLFTPPPQDVGRESGWQVGLGGAGPGGEPLPLGSPACLTFGCTAPSWVFLAYTLVFDSGFELPYVVLYKSFDGGNPEISGPNAIPCCTDADRDGMCTDSQLSTFCCDCDDANPAVRPGGAQVCDGVNNNCSHPAWPSLVGTNEYDDDGDGVSECAGDCDDSDLAVAALPGEAGPGLVWSADETTLSWGAAPHAAVHHAYRGTLDAAGGFAYDHACFGGNLPQPSVSDATIPAAGGLYYLVSGANACGEGTLGAGTSGERPNFQPCP